MTKSTYWAEDPSEPTGIRQVEQFDASGMRSIACDAVGGHTVSTMFIGNSHGFHSRGDGSPLPYESQVTVYFDGICEQFHLRWRTADESKLAHDAIVAHLETGPKSADEVNDYLDMLGNQAWEEDAR